MSNDSGQLLVVFQGAEIECANGADAAAIIDAERIMNDAAFSSHAPPELQRLAEILERYGCPDSANLLRALATSFRVLS